MKSSIFIFSRGVQTGKTTTLMEWAKNKRSIGGILTPDVDGLRKIYDLQSKEYFKFELTEDAHEEAVKIGRFIFSAKAFQEGQNILTKALERNVDWLVIDEVGKLEVLEDEGFEPAVTNVIKSFQTEKTRGKLVLVIRDSLLETAIEKYGLEGAEIFHDTLPK